MDQLSRKAEGASEEESRLLADGDVGVSEFDLNGFDIT